jgi:hypothetical protein
MEDEDVDTLGGGGRGVKMKIEDEDVTTPGGGGGGNNGKAEVQDVETPSEDGISKLTRVSVGDLEIAADEDSQVTEDGPTTGDSEGGAPGTDHATDEPKLGAAVSVGILEALDRASGCP